MVGPMVWHDEPDRSTPVDAAHLNQYSADLAASAAAADASAAAAAASAALAVAPTDAAMAAAVGNPASASSVSLKGQYAPTIGPRPYYLNAYNAFFLSAGAWVTGQGTTSTTLTAQATAGASVMAVTSGASFINGTSIITNPGTATQQIYTVTAGGGTASLTVTPNIVTTLASGATVLPLWTNSTHLTNPEGMSSWGYWAVNAKNPDGSYVLTDPGATRPVVILGDSWASQLGANFAVHVHTRFPSATVTNVGVSGNTSTQMIARFAADVPTNAAFVFINEPGVNDVAGGFTQATIAANLETLVGLIRGIGATPIITGMVPLFDYPAASAARSRELVAQVGDGTVFPAQSASAVAARYPAAYSPESKSVGAGTGALATVTTGIENTVFGMFAGDAITTGQANTFAGREAGTALTTGNNNTAVGQNALRADVTGGLNTAIGQAALATTTVANSTGVGANALLLASTGANNTVVGKDAGYSVNGNTAKATTTGHEQVAIGYQAGCSAANSLSTAIGAFAEAGGAWSTALGASSLASGNGSVAIGTDNAGTGASATATNAIALGTALHTTTTLGRLVTAVGTTTQAGVNIPHGAAPTTPVNGDVWTTTAGLFVRVNGATVGPLT
jgi:hypothetical protein